MEVSNRTQTVCHCQTVQQLQFFTIIICLTVMNRYSLLLSVLIAQLVILRACNDIRVESVKGLKINTTEMNTSIAGKLLKIRC
jgi:hypothetical protein